jgi:antitoxin MazE
MITHIRKWGNSFAIRIPKLLADEMNVAEGTSVELKMKDRSLVVEPALEPQGRSLASLLADVTDDNRHDAWDEGGSQGRETW